MPDTIEKSPLPVVSGRFLGILAALVWYAGGILLLLKGGGLLLEADRLEPGRIWPWMAVFAGVLIGGLKARYIFSKSCRKNLDRIAALDRPRIWQFFRPGFFLFLILMILIGGTLSRLAHNNYPFLICVATLDLGIATALLGSSYVFWKQKELLRKEPNTRQGRASVILRQKPPARNSTR